MQRTTAIAILVTCGAAACGAAATPTATSPTAPVPTASAPGAQSTADSKAEAVAPDAAKAAALQAEAQQSQMGTLSAFGGGSGATLHALNDIGAGGGVGAGAVGAASSARAGRAQLRQGNPTVRGALPLEVVQRVVRQRFGAIRQCYLDALDRDASLAGSVSTTFVIDKTGSVVSASNGGSEVSDPDLVACVVNTFKTLSFPAPERGVVTVTYPISFSHEAQ